MKIDFTKMHGCGNDYIYVNCFAENVEDRPALARKISDRHFGIGGDGLICIDGTADMTVSDPTGGSQTGVVYGRMHAWRDKDFIRDFNSGANPMQQISAQVAKYWNKQRQNRLIGIMKGIFAITDDNSDYWDAWQNHKTNIAFAGSSGTAGEANMLNEASAAEAIQKAVGDNAGIFSLAIMHSKVALNLAKKQLLEFRKHTDNLAKRTMA